VLVTSRVDQLPHAYGVPLGGLAEPEAIKLIRLHADRKKLPQIEKAHAGDLLPLVEATGGNPQAIVMALALVNGPRELHDLRAVVDDLDRAGQDVRAIFNALYASHWAELPPDAQHLLFAMSFFVEAVDREALQSVAGLSGPFFASALGHLRRRFLLETREPQDRKELPHSLHPLTRAFVGTKLVERPDWEQAARERWVDWYVRFSQEHARQVGKNPSFEHEPVRKQWKNLWAVTAWCAAPEHERYDDFRELWHEDRMRAFSGGLGYWDDRVQWLDWLIQAAERRGDLAVAVDAMSHQAWTLTTMGQLAEADRRLARAWELREHVELLARAKLARHRAWLCIHQQEFTKAERWLGEHGALLAEVPTEDPERVRELNHVLEYSGLICYEQQNYGQAEALFQRMLEDARAIGWARARLDAQNGLARVAMAQGRLERADELLRAALLYAQTIDDRSGIASCKGYLAHLELLRGNRVEACRWAREALEEFKSLGRQLEMEDVRHIIAECGEDEGAQ
jgi:LuxR family glucitol operon transcriptional activator